jgi:tetratricopeptide (TPR) repeat protein
MNDEARAELERVLRYDPNHLNAIKDLSSLYFLNGFQDLYKEYLFKLFTLDPINEEVIDEVKKLGEYELWSPVSPVQPPEIVVDDGGSEPSQTGAESSEQISEFYTESPAAGELDDQEILKSSTEETEERNGADSVFPDRIDLSQFDNLDDDFTTILHGKLEYPDAKPKDLQENPELQKAKEDIFGGEVPVVDKAPTEEIVETMDELLGEDEEIETQDLEKIVSSEEYQETESTVPIDSESISQENIPPISKPDIIPTDQSPKPLSTDPAMIHPEMNDPMPSSPQESEVASAPEEKTTIPFSTDSDKMSEEEDEKFEQPRIISQTLGEILVSQKKYTEAKSVFEALREKQPQNKSLDVKIAYLDQIIGLEKVGKSKTITQ